MTRQEGIVASECPKLESAENAPYRLKEFSFDDVHVRQVTDDVAVVACRR